LAGVKDKVREKMLFNIRLAQVRTDPELLKKLNDNIWEFRTRYGSDQYRLLAFWDKRSTTGTLVIVSHGFVKKTDKVPGREILRAERAREKYFSST
jgi:phage-related protein